MSGNFTQFSSANLNSNPLSGKSRIIKGSNVTNTEAAPSGGSMTNSAGHTHKIEVFPIHVENMVQGLQIHCSCGASSEVKFSFEEQ